MFVCLFVFFPCSLEVTQVLCCSDLQYYRVYFCLVVRQFSFVMDGCHQSYPWRTESKNPLVYLVSVNNWLVEWSAKDGYMGRDQLCPRQSEQSEQYCWRAPGRLPSRKFLVWRMKELLLWSHYFYVYSLQPLFSVDYIRSIVQPKPKPKLFSGLMQAVYQLSGSRMALWMYKDIINYGLQTSHLFSASYNSAQKDLPKMD